MAIVGITIDRTNPSFTINDFVFWMPQYTNFMKTEEGITYFNNLYEIVNNKIFKSIFGTDWKYAMSLGIAHYLQLISNRVSVPQGDTLQGIAGGGSFQGVISSASVGGFSKTYDIDKTLLNEDETKFWNQTPFGAELMALLKTKAIPSILVVTNNPIPGA